MGEDEVWKGTDSPGEEIKGNVQRLASFFRHQDRISGIRKSKRKSDEQWRLKDNERGRRRWEKRGPERNGTLRLRRKLHPEAAKAADRKAMNKPGRREQRNEQQKTKRATDHDYRNALNAKRRLSLKNKRANDGEWRKLTNEKAKKSRQASLDAGKVAPAKTPEEKTAISQKRKDQYRKKEDAATSQKRKDRYRKKEDAAKALGEAAFKAHKEARNAVTRKSYNARKSRSK
jgi:colicin import membrane protein